MSAKRSFSGNLAWYALGQGSAVMVGMVFSVVSARSLGAWGKGELAFFVAVLMMGTFVLDPGVRTAVTFLVARGRSESQLLFSVLATAMTVTCLGIALSRFVPAVDLWVALGVGLLTARDGVAALLLGRQRMAAVASLGALYSLVNLGAFVLFVVSLGLGVTGAKASVLVGFGVCLTAGLFLVRGQLGDVRRCLPSLSLLREQFTYGMKAYPGTLLSATATRLDLFVVAALLDHRQLGYYSIVVMATELIAHMPAALGAVLFPRVAAEPESAHYFTVKSLRHALPWLALATAGCWVAAEPLVLFVYTKVFEPVASVLMYASLGWVFLGVRSILTGYFNGVGRPQVQSVAAASYTVLVGGVAVLLIPRLGLVGAGIAQAIANAVVGLGLLVFFSRDAHSSLWSNYWPTRSELRDYDKLWHGFIKEASRP